MSGRADTFVFGDRPMRARERKPVTKTQACLIAGYLAIALARQVARDIRTIIRWAEDFAVDEIHR